MENGKHDIRSQLADWLQEICALDGADAETCAHLREKLAEQAFNLVVVGQFKRGKSTLINALLGAEILPVAVVPLTAVVTQLHYGETASAQVLFDNGTQQDIPLAALADYVTEAGNPRNRKNVREVTVRYPSEWLKAGNRLVDTPGIGSIHDHNTEVTYRYLPQADAVILLISVDQPASRAELDFLGDLRRHAGKVFCVLNKADHLSEAELAESTEFTARALAEAVGEPVAVYPVSARLALQGRRENAPALLQQSRLPAFAEALRRFLREEKGEVWERSMRHHLLRLLEQARLSAGLERQALTEPLERIQANLEAFARKKQDTLQARSDFEALLAAAAKKLIKDKVEPDLDAFKPALRQRLGHALDAWFDELRGQGSSALQDGLESRLQETLRQAFDSWRRDEDAAVRAAFDALCQRFWGHAQAIADELVRYSAELFALPFQSTHAESLWRARSGFYYKFWQEPPSLVLLSNQVARWLPDFIGQPLILRRARERARDLIEVQGGRLRYDFEERIKESANEFRRDMLGRLDATVAGIENAVAKGMAVRRQGSDAAASRLAALSAGLARMEELDARMRAGNSTPVPPQAPGEPAAA